MSDDVHFRLAAIESAIQGLRDPRRVERDTRPVPVSRAQGIQHVATSIPPSRGVVLEVPGVGVQHALTMVPITDLTAPMEVTRLGLFAGVSHTSGEGVDLRLSLWAASGRGREHGRWSARLLRATETRHLARRDPDQTDIDFVQSRFVAPAVIEPPGVYFIGLQVNQVGGALSVLCPQGALADGRFYAAKTAADQLSFNTLRDQVSSGEEAQHFFAAAMSELGYHFFVGG
ncbi:MAG: hypothetical protein HC882_01435 [Acidobacteria bacterium]|nr:hypothetical protein [Acidobacteriota bacterium]